MEEFMIGEHREVRVLRRGSEVACCINKSI